MSEDVTKKMTQFTPTLPDRDALLFAAGRASARPSPMWKMLSGMLAISQVAMVAYWLARPSALVNTLTNPVDTTVDDSPTPFTPDPYSYIALSKSADLELPRMSSDGVDTIRSSPPLKAGWRGELPN
jgi:hypothetical protein